MQNNRDSRRNNVASKEQQVRDNRDPRKVYGIEYPDAYPKLTMEIGKKIVAHCTRYRIRNKRICAWYADWEDFCSDWCDEVGYTRTQARELLHGGRGEFMQIKGFGILRFDM